MTQSRKQIAVAPAPQAVGAGPRMGIAGAQAPGSAAGMAPDGELHGITDLAREFGISLRAIRFYEDKGLLAPRRINGGRAYTRRDRVRLGLILRGKAVGLSLAEIEHILSLYGEHGEGHARQIDYLVGRIDAALAELDTRRRAIEAMMAELGAVRDELRRVPDARRRTGKAKARGGTA